MSKLNFQDDFLETTVPFEDVTEEYDELDLYFYSSSHYYTKITTIRVVFVINGQVIRSRTMDFMNLTEQRAFFMSLDKILYWLRYLKEPNKKINIFIGDQKIYYTLMEIFPLVLTNTAIRRDMLKFYRKNFTKFKLIIHLLPEEAQERYFDFIHSGRILREREMVFSSPEEDGTYQKNWLAEQTQKRKDMKIWSLI